MPIETAFFGSLARDAELKTSKSGKPYLRMTERVENGETAQFISVTSFDPDAIAAAGKFVKGSRVYVEGKLSLDSWTGQDGVAKQGLSCLSFHTRLSQIGNAKPQREHATPATGRERAARSDYAPPRKSPAFDDDIGF